MASKDLTHRILAALALAPANYALDADGATVDTQGFESVAFLVAVEGAAAGTDIAISVEESDDGTTFTAASAADTHEEALAEIDENTPDGAVQIGYRGNKRYVRLAVVRTAGSVNLGAVAVLGDPREAPTY